MPHHDDRTDRLDHGTQVLDGVLCGGSRMGVARPEARPVIGDYAPVPDQLSEQWCPGQHRLARSSNHDDRRPVTGFHPIQRPAAAAVDRTRSDALPDLDVDRQRAIVESLVEAVVVAKASRRGAPWTPDRLQVVWRAT